MARNVIDSLVVELGLDASKFTRNQREAVDNFKRGQQELREEGKRTEDVARRNSESMSLATQKILGFVAAFAGVRAITNFTAALVKSDDELGRSSKILETNARELAVWRQAVEAAGGSAEDATSTLTNLKQQFTTFSLTGQGGEWIKWFRAVGVEVTDAQNRMRPFREILLDLSEALNKRATPAQAAAIAAQAGISPGMLQLLLQGREAVRKELEKQEGLVSITERDTQAARELAQAWREATQAAASFGGELTRGLYPILTKTLNAITHFMSWWRTPQGRAAADKQGEDLHNRLRRRFGTPGEVDEKLRGALGGAGGVFGGADGTPLRVKPGAGMERTHAGTQALARTLQDEIPGINRFTSGNDAFHQGRPSAHNRGLAMDFTVKNRGEAGAIAEQVRAKLKAMGINATVIDEYSRPSPFSSGGHIHVQFGSEADAAKYAGARGSVNGALRTMRDPAMGASGTVGPGAGVTSSTSNQNSSVTIGTLNVNTQATDAPAIARDIRGAIEREGGLAVQANAGPS